METFWNDRRYGVRMMFRTAVSPGCIIRLRWLDENRHLSVVKAVLLRPLPYDDSIGSLVWETSARFDTATSRPTTSRI